MVVWLGSHNYYIIIKNKLRTSSHGIIYELKRGCFLFGLNTSELNTIYRGYIKLISVWSNRFAYTSPYFVLKRTAKKKSKIKRLPILETNTNQMMAGIIIWVMPYTICMLSGILCFFWSWYLILIYQVF